MSVREKYRATFNDFRRADSVPEKISVFRRVWAWLILASEDTVAICGFFLIPIYLIGISVWKFEECPHDDTHIPMFLLFLGTTMIVCALYFPFKKYGKKKANEARQDRINNHMEPLFDREIGEDELNQYIPCRINKLSHSDGFIYWTAFVISIVYLLWLIILFTAFISCCCCVAIVPFFMKKLSRNNRSNSPVEDV